jgi:ribosomal protein L12E/L44/L45/RPP1/RPP2
LRQKKQSPPELQGLEEQSAEQLEELLADVQLEEQPAQEGQQPGPAQEQEQQEGQGETEQEEAEQAEPEDQNTGGLGDLLNLFEEEDTSIATLEAFCKGLPDVSVDELFEKSKKVASHLHRSNELRAYEAGDSG